MKYVPVSFAWTLLSALLWVQAVFAQPSASEFRESLDQFVREALKSNPELQEAQASIKMYKEIPSQAGALDDPMLEFGVNNVPINSLSMRQEPMTMKQVGVSQKLPFPGKRGLKSDMAEKDVDVAREMYREAQLRVTRSVKISFYELCYLMTAIDITKQNKSLLEQLVKTAQSKYSVGKGIQQDVIRAQVELSKTMSDLIELEERKGKEEARLNTLLNRLPQSHLHITHGLQRTPFSSAISKLEKETEENHPILKRLQLLRNRALLAKKLAEKESYPDVNIGFSYARRESIYQMDNPDLFTGFVAVNIPIWQETKQKKKASEEMYRSKELEQTWLKTRNSLFQEIKERMEEEARGNERISLLQTAILPQARLSLESALSGYRVDKVDFLTLLDNQINLFKLQLQEHREITEHEKSLAMIEFAIGRELN